MLRHRATTRISWPRGKACDKAKPGCDTAGGSATTQRHRAARARGLGAPGRVGWLVSYALGAPNQFLTQYIISESLFGLPFMNTVHKIFRKKK